jgi:two-component system, chemotaxis family, chemotaxis protein CheY
MMAFDSSMSVVVIDDYGTMIRIIRNLPRQLAFADNDASDGGAALKKMREKAW